MAKKYRTPILLDLDDNGFDTEHSGEYHFDSTHELKDELATSFVYGDDNYEEEYIVPDVVDEVIAADPVAEESGE